MQRSCWVIEYNRCYIFEHHDKSRILSLQSSNLVGTDETEKASEIRAD